MSNVDSYPIVHRISGSPGSGKTTRVVGNPELGINGLFIENSDEYPLEEQMLVTYTNAGVDEAADRLARMTDAPKYKINNRVTTIHSRCFQTLGLKREDVAGHWKKKSFCDAHDLEFGWDDDSDDIMGADMQQGNLLFRIYDWLQNNRKNKDEWEDCPADWGFGEDPEWLMYQWEGWKEDNGWMGFGDMIEDVIELGYDQLKNLGWGVLFPDEDTTTKEMFMEARNDPERDPDIIRGKGAFVDTKVLYVDEFQDLTPLQYEWYLLQKLVAEKVYIGGDADQTIYGFSGADPSFLLDEEGDMETLDTTYRIPSEIWEVCHGVIKQVDKRRKKEVEPNGDGGEFYTYRAPSTRQLAEHLKEDECMALFRARYQVDEFRNDLHDFGIPYRNMSTYDVWDDDMVNLKNAFGVMCSGEGKINGEELNALIEYAEGNMYNHHSDVTESEKVMSHFGGVSSERLNEIFPFMEKERNGKQKALMYISKTNELNGFQEEALKGTIYNKTWDLEPDRVRIGTIHSSKGKEAETVILATDTTKTIVENMMEELRDKNGIFEDVSSGGITDAERRVYYVGMTRASNELVLAQGAINPEMAIDINTLLDEEHIPDEWESGQPTLNDSW